MNDVESQADKVQWADDEVDLPSDCYSSSGDDSDAEVPDVTEPLASTSNGFQGVLFLSSLYPVREVTLARLG